MRAQLKLKKAYWNSISIRVSGSGYLVAICHHDQPYTQQYLLENSMSTRLTKKVSLVYVCSVKRENIVCYNYLANEYHNENV